MKQFNMTLGYIANINLKNLYIIITSQRKGNRRL